MFSRLRIGLFAALLAALWTARPVFAHDGSPHGGGPLWAYVSFEPLVVVGLLLSGLVYTRGAQVLAQRGGRTAGQRWAFAGGMLVLVIALVSPVDGLAGQLFWVHMLQHSLLMLAAAPLLVYSHPLPPLLLGLPEGLRRAVGRGWRRWTGLRAFWREISRPWVAWLLHALVLWVWHAPPFYQASVENEAIHAVQHLSFLGAALLFWWAALHTLSARERRGVGILYLFTTALQSGLLGALLTFSPTVLYPVYAGRTEAWGFSTLADQQLAGAIMWVPGGIVYLLAALWLMKHWLESFEAGEGDVLRKDPE